MKGRPSPSIGRMLGSLAIILVTASGAYTACNGRWHGRVGAAPDRYLSATVVTRAYDVRQLLCAVSARISDDSSELIRKPDWSSQSGCIEIPSTDVLHHEQYYSDELKRLIVTLISPESWRDNGGDIGTLNYAAGVLIVQQSLENQALVEHFLNQLEGQP